MRFRYAGHKRPLGVYDKYRIDLKKSVTLAQNLVPGKIESDLNGIILIASTNSTAMYRFCQKIKITIYDKIFITLSYSDVIKILNIEDNFLIT